MTDLVNTKTPNSLKSLIVTAIVLVFSFVLNFALPVAALAAGPAPVNLFSISTNNFAILSKAGITNTGSHTSAILGNIGASPITAAAMDNVFCSEITGIIYGVNAAYTGSGNVTCFAGNPPLANKTLVDNAVADMGTAYTDAAGRAPGVGSNLNVGGGTLSGQNFAPGTYTWGTPVNITGDITLTGTATDVWLFQISGTLNISSGKQVILSGGALPSNIFWQVTGATTLGTTAVFNGNILDQTNIALQTGATLNGRALAQTAVTLDGNAVTTAVNPDFVIPIKPAECTGNYTKVIHGTNGANTLNGTSGNDIIFGYGGDDKINGNGGNDCLVGGLDNDKIDGGSGNDIILGQEGNDSNLSGGSGNDKIYGGLGNDIMNGGSGKDTLTGNEETDIANGGSGNDTCSAEAQTSCP